MGMVRLASWWRTLWQSEVPRQPGRGTAGCAHSLLHLAVGHALLPFYLLYLLLAAVRKPNGRHGLWVKAPTLRRWELWFLSATDFAGRLALLSLAVLLYALAVYLFGKPPPWHEQLGNISGGCALVLASVWWSWALYAAGERLGWRLATWDGVAGGRPPRFTHFLQQWRAGMGALACGLLTVFILFTALALCGVSWVPQPDSQAQNWLLCGLAGTCIDWLLLLIVTRQLE